MSAGSTPFADLDATATALAATRSRTAKITALSELLGRLDPAEVPAAVGMLLGSVRQGRLGVGWRTLEAVPREPAGQASLTVAEVDQVFSALAATTGPGSANQRGELLQSLFSRATEQEQDFLIRVILGDMRTGALEGVLTDAIARACELPPEEVRRAAMLTGDLGETARLARTGADLSAIGLQVGTPVFPMLAGTAPSPTEALAAVGTAAVQAKLDGARIQVHRLGEDIRVYTRSLAEITERVPDVVEAARALPVHAVILDGETLALTDDGRPRPFQESMARFGSDAGDVVLRPWFFDVLHVDGRDLIDSPLRDRLEVLAQIAGDLMVPGTVTGDPSTAEHMLEESLVAGHEGVLVKGIDSTYAAGRRGSAWLKVKPVHTVDLVVLAAEWGYGRRTGWLSNLHLGARDPDGHYGPPGGFVMVGKTFKGLTDAMLSWQTERFTELATERTETVVRVHPEQVVEIAIDGVQRSTRYPGGVALRFARVVTYRDDKRATDADPISGLRALLPGQAPPGARASGTSAPEAASSADSAGRGSRRSDR
ncbi:ATP-dependent DNA ligase [Ruania halotolerans]|uniref:ATP-dependent DNA ligase n=1 Tax=Ruania halotolerans TaxID=2897773 RepID=UPI001E486C44|nr:ATP-dependent DNA ligase [Ruania halotolerans]UFU08053.1 ATP-dependent DNA ligase [Ruania halotolerans]